MHLFQILQHYSQKTEGPKLITCEKFANFIPKIMQGIFFLKHYFTFIRRLDMVSLEI